MSSTKKKTKPQPTDEVAALHTGPAVLEGSICPSPRAEQKLPQTFEVIADGVAVIDREGVCTDINASLVRMLGLRSRDEALGQQAASFIAPQNLDQAMAHVLRVVQDGETIREEYELVRADGTTIPAEIGGTLLRDPSGNPAGFVALVRDITRRRQAEDALRDSERLYRLLAENATDVIWTTDLNLRLTYISPSVQRLRGYTAEEAMKQTIEEIYTPASFERARDGLREALLHVGDDTAPTGQALNWTLEVEMYRKDGSTIWAEVTVTFLRGDDGKPAGLLGITRDISERKKVEQALEESERLYRLLAENAADVIWTTDLSMRLTYVSPSVQRLRGYTTQEAMAQTIEHTYAPASFEMASRVLAEELAREDEPGNDPGRVRTLELEQRRKDGSNIWTELTVTFLRDDDGKPAGLLGITRDISERKAAEQTIRHLAYHDPLTGLPNRLLFNEILQLELIRASRNQQLVALMILDLDGFKAVNDRYGHGVGDRLLVKVADRLRASVRKGDTVARMGGDEFVLILPEMAAHSAAAMVAEKALHALRRPFTISGRRIRITTSIGIAVYPQHGEGSDTLMKHADAAMYVAKAAGRDQFHCYDAASDCGAVAKC